MLRFRNIAFQFKLQDHVQGSVSNTIVLTWKIPADKLRTENTLLVHQLSTVMCKETEVQETRFGVHESLVDNDDDKTYITQKS